MEWVVLPLVAALGNLCWGRGFKGGRALAAGGITLAGSICHYLLGLQPPSWPGAALMTAIGIGYTLWRVWPTQPSLVGFYGKVPPRPSDSIGFIDDITDSILGVPLTEGQRRKWGTVWGLFRWGWGGLCCFGLLAVAGWLVHGPALALAFLLVGAFSPLTQLLYSVQRYELEEESTARAELLAGGFWGGQVLSAFLLVPGVEGWLR